MKKVPGRRDRVEAPEPRFPDLHQPDFSQVRQVSRGLGLRHLEIPDDVADAKFSAPEKTKDAKSRGIREGFEELRPPMEEGPGGVSGHPSAQMQGCRRPGPLPRDDGDRSDASRSRSSPG